MNVKLLFLAVGLLTVCVDYVNACTCLPQTVQKSCGFDYVLRGRVLLMRYVQGGFGQEREYSVFVDRYYKAIPNRPRFVRIRTARYSASCGVQLLKGQRYVISGRIKGGKLRTSRCTYTIAWNSIPNWEKQNLYCRPGAYDRIPLPPIKAGTIIYNSQ